jgi:hypothetical protein
MKRTTRLFCLQIAAVAAILSFGLQAHAETPREELVHAYYLVKTANNDYGDHKGAALHHMEVAAHQLGMDLKGGVSERERQWKSDEQMREADRLLHDARNKMEEHDRTRVADHLENAIKNIDKALEKR